MAMKLKKQAWVVKIGSALLTNNGKGLDHQAIQAWATQIAELTQQGLQVVIVSSGSVAEGMLRMGWQKRPHALHELQAAAAIGQMRLAQVWDRAFAKHEINTAQVLLTHDDLSNRKRYLNARSTLTTLVQLNVIPIINENDTVANDEIRFGDNDTLAALVANLICADKLILLTDQMGLFDADPRHHKHAKLIQQAAVDDPTLTQMAGNSKGQFGSGGMATKLSAARLAARSGTMTHITQGQTTDILINLFNNQKIGTQLLPNQAPNLARKQWLAGHMQQKGQLILDAGAVSALLKNGRSLLAVGIIAVKGNFERGDMVSCITETGQEIARGLINYSYQETQKIKRQPSNKIEALLGYIDEQSLIHRDNLVIF